MTPPRKVQTPGSYRLKEKGKEKKKRKREKEQHGDKKRKQGKRKVGRPSLVGKKSSSRKGNYRSRYGRYLCVRNRYR
jgi:hypothetical protein